MTSLLADLVGALGVGALLGLGAILTVDVVGHALDVLGPWAVGLGLVGLGAALARFTCRRGRP